MVLTHWYPVRGIRRPERTVDGLWRRFGVGPTIDRPALPIDVVEEDDRLVVRASLPGMSADEIDVTIEDGVLTIKGSTADEKTEEGNGTYLVRERRTGSFHRRLRLPDTVDGEGAESRYENGTLSVAFPKVEAKKARRLEIQVGK